MGTCCVNFSGTADQRRVNGEIDKKMKKTENESSNQTHRILLLGAGESGKTTIMKQIRKIYLGTIPAKRIEVFTSWIKQQCVAYMVVLCEQSIALNIPISSENIESRKYVLSLETPYLLDISILPFMKRLWSDSGISKTLSLREKYQIPDNVSYFLNDRMDAIAQKDYFPSFDDYVRIRMRTSGFVEEAFVSTFSDLKQLDTSNKHIARTSKPKISTMESPEVVSNDIGRASQTYKNMETNHDLAIANCDEHKHTFVFMDVGGQRAERKKWIRMMTDNIDVVVFVTAISEYDMTCFEDSNTNRLTESLNLFETILKAGFLAEKTVALFFNKYDLFKEKLANASKSTIRDHYSDFGDDKDPRNANHVCEFVYNKFLLLFETHCPHSQNVPHFHCTTALDVDQIKHLMLDIQLDLVANQLGQAGFI